MVIVDTTVWVDYFNEVDTRQTAWLDDQLTEQRLGLLDLIVCELLQGLATDDAAADVLRELEHFELLESGGLQLATDAAKNYRVLRQKGRTVRKTIDCLIATFCIRGGHRLLHSDGNFDPFEEHLQLQVVHP